MTLKLIAPPTLEIVSLADMKLFLRVDQDEDDELISALTAAAVAYLDGWSGVLGYCLGAQTYVLVYDAFPPGPILLPVGPLLQVLSIEYADAGQPYAVLPSSEYEVDAIASPGWIVPVSDWPIVEGTNAVKITFRAGHSAVADIHAAVPMIVKLLVGHWYLNREAVGPAMSEIPMSASSLIAAQRRIMV